MPLKIGFFVAAVSLLLINPAFAADDDPVLAKTATYIFKQSDLNRLITYSPPQLQKQIKEDHQQQVALIGKIMQQRAIADLARKERFDQTQEIKEKTGYIVDDFIAGEYLQTIKAKATDGIKLTDDDLRQYYRANTSMFTIPEQVKARHILIKAPKEASEEKKKEAREKAKDIYNKLKAGADFEKLAGQYSEDGATKPKNGDLGYLLRGQTEKSFEQAAFSLKPGEMSYIVETSQGYHIIFSEAHIESRVKAFDEVKDLIEKQVKERVANERVKDFIKKATQNAGLEIYDDKVEGKVKQTK